MTDYLRNRPFLCVEVTFRPSPDVNTKQKGWQQTKGAMQAFDKVSFLDRVNDSQRSKSLIIIDIINSSVIVNKSGKTDNEVIASYFGNYKDKVKAALSVWAQKEAKNLANSG